MIKLDGSHGEGGGSILRQALAFSTLTGKSFEIFNIRKGRCKSGLQHQHLCAVELAKQLCSAAVDGAEINSECLKFTPSKLEGRTISAQIGTAGSMTLALQSILLPSIFGDKKTRIKLSGASDTFWSQPVEYFQYVFLPHLRKFADIDFKLERRGYYPKGGGKIDLTIKPKYSLSDFKDFEEFHDFLKKNAPKINLQKQGDLVQIKGTSHASADLQKSEVAERQARAAKQFLNVDCPIRIQVEYSNALCAGSGICLWAVFANEKGELDALNPVVLGADSLGEKGKRAELVGKEAATNLLKEINSKAPVDKYLADQLIPFMALVGNSRIFCSEITNHCRTNIKVVEDFLGKTFEVDESKRIIRSL